MEPYILRGLILPERASLTFGPIEFGFRHLTLNTEGRASINVVLNNVTVWWFTDVKWDVFDLRNSVAQAVLNEVAMIGFVKGCAYEVEIRQVLNRSLGIDYVYGIGIPCIESRNANVDLGTRLNEVRARVTGELGIYVLRCLNDLVMAMKMPHDTAFYCHRAMEALRHYCKNRFGLEHASEREQWAKLVEITGFKEEYVNEIRELSKPLRHGDILPLTSEKRAEIFLRTWDVVDAFIDNA